MGKKKESNIFTVSLPIKINRKTETKLFELLEGLGFVKTIKEEGVVVFSKEKEMFIFPSGMLQEHHFISTRKHLDMNGHIESEEFDKIFLDKE